MKFIHLIWVKSDVISPEGQQQPTGFGQYRWLKKRSQDNIVKGQHQRDSDFLEEATSAGVRKVRIISRHYNANNSKQAYPPQGFEMP